jgi:outer membrane protein assembly factor BamD (BamD/ComL family)
VASEQTGSQRFEFALLVVLAGVAVFAGRGSKESRSSLAAEPTASVRVQAPRSSRASSTGSTSRPVTAAGEVQLLGPARTALRSGDTTTALSTLETYETRFPNGALHDQATLLKIEALVRRGELDKAKLAAEPLLRKNPDSPMANRAQALLAGTPAPPPSRVPRP